MGFNNISWTALISPVIKTTNNAGSIIVTGFTNARI